MIVTATREYTIYPCTSIYLAHIVINVCQAALTDHTVYSATKGALDMVSRVMALELGPHNIRVNCVNPTVVLTDMGRLGWSKPEKAGPMLAKIPLGRFAGNHSVLLCNCNWEHI